MKIKDKILSETSEEVKQRVRDTANKLVMKQETKCYCGHTTTCDCGPEETKQECMITKIMQMDAEMAYDSLPKQDKIMERFIANAKQETLEEVAVINYKKLYEGEPLTQDVPIDAFKQGSKWQMERSYSEEEVMDILLLSYSSISDRSLAGADLRKWFKQFKKK